MILTVITTTIACACSRAESDELVAARSFFSPQELQRVLRCGPLPAPKDPTNAVMHGQAAFSLGRALFYDPRLSASGDHSCASCHDPAKDWTDGRALAIGLAQVERNTPSLWNSALNRWFFWDGRADSLWAQALEPIEHPLEMGGDRREVAELLENDPHLGRLYESAFGPLPELASADDVDRVFAQVGKALAAFEARILVDETPFDRFVRGLQNDLPEDLAALNDDQKAGARLFFGEARCHLCHHGAMLSDLEFHDIRLPRAGDPQPARFDGISSVLSNPFNGLGPHSDDPQAARTKLGYLTRTKHQRGEWKTPGLRNVARTGPYMHNGIYESLEQVIEHYSSMDDAAPRTHADSAEVLVSVDLNPTEKRQLRAFLEALSGPPPAQELLAPERTLPLPTGKRNSDS